MNIDDFLKSTTPVEWAIEGLVPYNHKGLVVARPGNGKSWLLEEMAICVVTGDDFLGHFPVSKPGNVLLLDQDTPTSMLGERLQALLMAHSVRSHELIVESQEGHALDLKAGLAELKSLVSATQPVLVILETLDTITSSSFNENHASDVRKLFNNLNEIQATHPCTFLVSHHFGKKGNDSEPTSWIRGSSALTAAVDVAYSIQNVRSPSDAKTFLVQPIPKRVKTASAFQFDLRGHEEDGMTAVAFLKWLRDWDVDLEPELIEKRVLILELVRDRGTEGVTVNDVTNAAEGYVGQKQVRQILDSLEKEGLVAMNSEAHNRFRFWIPECAPASVPEEATKEPSPSRERWEPL